jgi:hypothetical protein
VRISADIALLAIVAILGLFDGVRLLGTPSFVPEPLEPSYYLIGLAAMLLLATAAETVLKSPTSVTKNRRRSERLFLLLRSPVFQAWLGLILYAFLLKSVGYFLSTLCFLIASIRIFGERRWFWFIGGGSVLALVFYVIFRKMAGIPLP